jgi:hypothetical protein
MRDEPGLFHALSDTISRATELVQLEFKVLRAELEEKAAKVKAGLAFILAGAILVTAALFLLLQAAVLGLVQGGMSPTGATLLVAVACIAAGLVLVVSGRKQLDGDVLTPDRTIHGIQRDSALVKEKLT